MGVSCMAHALNASSIIALRAREGEDPSNTRVLDASSFNVGQRLWMVGPLGWLGRLARVHKHFPVARVKGVLRGASAGA